MSKKFKRDKILIVGAGEAGRIILAEYNRRNKKEDIIGFIDDNPVKKGKDIDGIPVLSGRKDLSGIIAQYNINQIIIALPSVDTEIINQIVNAIINTDPEITIQILPKITKYFSTSLSRELEELYLSDIIDREEFDLDVNAIEEKFRDKVVLVTGAGGSIGSELCKQLFRFEIKKLICIGRGENSIYNLAKTLGDNFEEIRREILYKIIDIKDYNLLEEIFYVHKPDIVFHAAAHKHVPLMELNCIEAVQNNVGGTLNVLELSSKYNAGEFVLISTDKAVHPVNIMGATKRLAEIITNYYHKKKDLKTSIVRFGNVLGSRGSVIPLFREQIEKGGPVTITHRDVTRYFMSIPEASLLVINSAAYSKGGECFVLDMGRQYKIFDIACNLIRLYGHEPGKDIKIVFTGLRPGEKLFEELSYKDENIKRTDNEKIFIINNNGSDWNQVEFFINNKLSNLHRYSGTELREIIKSIVAEYDYSSYEEAAEDYSKIVS